MPMPEREPKPQPPFSQRFLNNGYGARPNFDTIDAKLDPSRFKEAVEQVSREVPPADAPDPAEVLAALTKQVDEIFYKAGARINEVGDKHQISIIPDSSEISREPASNPGPAPEYYQKMMERDFGYDGSI